MTQERLVAVRNESSTLAAKLLLLERLLSAANATNMSAVSAVRPVFCYPSQHTIFQTVLTGADLGSFAVDQIKNGDKLERRRQIAIA